MHGVESSSRKQSHRRHFNIFWLLLRWLLGLAHLLFALSQCDKRSIFCIRNLLLFPGEAEENLLHAFLTHSKVGNVQSFLCGRNIFQDFRHLQSRWKGDASAMATKCDNVNKSVCACRCGQRTREVSVRGSHCARNPSMRSTTHPLDVPLDCSSLISAPGNMSRRSRQVSSTVRSCCVWNVIM